MPLDKTIRKTLLISSGPIVIGQAAEFDYAGVQACRALREEGIETVLVNSNPATIMTDPHMADKIYIEPLRLPVLRRIIEREQPDSILSSLGGQTGLTLSMQLAKEGFLAAHGVRLLGARPETIDKAEDRLQFKQAMEAIGQPCIPSVIAEEIETALAFAAIEGYPLIIRPAFTLGGTGGGIAHDENELREIVERGLLFSPISQVLVEKSVAGWKEIEFEVMRDSAGNVITVCGMENLDPVGVHTGDSIVVAPCMTLSDKEYQMLRSAALSIITALEVEGGCNCQFALCPDSFEYAVIEVNPRVSRSSALASKATGYPIARVATKIAVGYRLDEIPNQVTGKTSACFEPALDYVVVKIPRFPFDKFVYADRHLDTQMKATGEVMAIAPTFEQALLKAVSGAEIPLRTTVRLLEALDDAAIKERLSLSSDERIFVVYEALRRGIAVDEIFSATQIDRWFLGKLLHLARLEKRLATEPLTGPLYREAKALGFGDGAIGHLSETPLPPGRPTAYRMVDTCAGEFAARTPYFYSSYDEDNEALAFIDKSGENRRVLVLGSGPIRIGQGIEFDYCSVRCVWALKALGYEVAILNNNPETVSTDFDTADRLYFDPLTPESVRGVLATEEPLGVVVAFGGQTAIKLTKFLAQEGVPILGTQADAIDIAEDRDRFEHLLNECNIPQTTGETIFTLEEALASAERLGYPVMLRPSYVLGGQNMIIAHGEADVREYMGLILSQKLTNPVLIDRYLMGTEAEVDVLCDGEDVLIPGIMEHIERAGVHSGDSIAVYPAWSIPPEIIDDMVDYTRRMALALGVKGILNIQYVVYAGKATVIEANPRASRTVPYISKVTGVPIVELATRIMMGGKLKDLGYGTGLYKKAAMVAVKVPVFSFEKLTGADTQLGPEMKSTGEVLGLAHTLSDAIFKGFAGAGFKMETTGAVLLSLRDRDKPELVPLARKLHLLKMPLYATAGTAKILSDNHIPVTVVPKIGENPEDNPLTLIHSGKLSLVISTSEKGRQPARDSVKIRRKAVEMSLPCLTSVDTAHALADALLTGQTLEAVELVELHEAGQGS